MKFSTKSRYALRLMAELARYAPGSTVSLKEISERQQLSLKYLEQIVTPLARVGLVKSERGSQGGYRSRVTLSMYWLITSSSPAQKGRVKHWSDMGHSLVSLPRQGMGATLPSMARRISPAVVASSYDNRYFLF